MSRPGGPLTPPSAPLPGGEGEPGRSHVAILAVLAVAWAGVIFWASSQSNPFPFLPRSWFSHDKLLHAGAFGLLGALVFGALHRTRLPWRAVGLAALVTTAYGATDEWHQSYVPNRDPDPRDVAADAVGAGAGAALAAVVLRRRVARASIRA